MKSEPQTPQTTNGVGFINQTELLRRLPVSRRTIHNWRTSGKIPSIKIGRRVLFCWENVAEALRRLERGVQP
jgi:excisionase family DNA binding protein